jgi:ABC-type phosphate transport system permease subunit
MLTAEEAMKMVPTRMQEAAIDIGCTQSQMVWRIVLPTALPSIRIGVMFARQGDKENGDDLADDTPPYEEMLC